MFPEPLGWVGPSPTVRWANHGLFWEFSALPAPTEGTWKSVNGQRRDVSGNKEHFRGCQAHPHRMHGTCQSSTSWAQYSPKCRLSPGVGSVSVDLELTPEAGVCCLSGVLGHRTKARWGNSEVPGTVVPPRPHCGEAQVSFWLVSRAPVTLTPPSSSGRPRVSLF